MENKFYNYLMTSPIVYYIYNRGSIIYGLETKDSDIDFLVVVDSEFKIPDFNNSWAQYATVRANGLFEFGPIVTEPENLLPERAEKILSEIQNSIIPKIANEKKFFTESYKSKIIEQLKDSQTQATETPSELLTSIRSWWTNTNAEYFFSYYDNLSKVTQDDVKRIVEKYISNKKPLVSVLLNPEIYKSTKARGSRAFKI